MIDPTTALLVITVNYYYLTASMICIVWGLGTVFEVK